MEWLQTYKIGKHLLENGFEPVDAYFENYKPEKNKTPFVVEIIIDFKKEKICFDCFQLELNDKDVIQKKIKEDNFFTQVGGNFKNYYLTTKYTKAESIKAFFENKTKIKKSKNQIEKREFGGTEKEYEDLIKEGLLDENFRFEDNNPLIKWRNKLLSDKGIINKLNFSIDNIKLFVEKSKQKEYEKKSNPNNHKDYIQLFSETEPLETRLNLSENGTDEVAYIVPVIIDKEGNRIELNKLKEYRNFCYHRLLALADIKKCSFFKDRVCYFTGEKGVYPVKMPRDNINILKVSTDTQKNYYSYYKGERFFVSRNAYECLKFGAFYINKVFVTRIAQRQHYIIPDFNKNFDLSNFSNNIKPKVDLAFQSYQYKKTKRVLEERISKDGLNSLTFIGYEKTYKEIDLVNRIKTVSPDRYNLIIDEFLKAKEYYLKTRYANHIQPFSFGSIYFIIPEGYKRDPKTKEKKPLKKCYTLELFKCLLEDIPVDVNVMMSHYKKLINIYRFGHPDKDKKQYGGSLNISLCGNEKNYRKLRDRAIEVATMKYLILIKLINNLYKKPDSMETCKIDENKTKEFFNEFCFEEDKRALFYLGKLIRRVAEVQKKQNHGHKPVLSKINYSGMKLAEIKRLSIEIIDKLRQYNSKKYNAFNFGETDLKCFEYYFCKNESKWSLTETENVFYIFSGYGMYWETIEQKEKTQLEEVDIKEDDIDNEDNDNIETNE